jgi:LEA14-like dessication related protein
MLKKGLIIGGVGLLGFGLYRYFKYQINQAMNYDFSIKNFKYLGIEGDNINVSATIDITNKSSFALTINSFDLDLYFKGYKFSHVSSTVSSVILPNENFEVTGIGVINAADLKETVPILVMDILKEKPIDVEVTGTVKVNFMGINHTVAFNKEKFNYSTNLLAEYGLKEKTDKLKQKYSKIFSAFGIN